jgi:hypothetical protein
VLLESQFLCQCQFTDNKSKVFEERKKVYYSSDEALSLYPLLRENVSLLKRSSGTQFKHVRKCMGTGLGSPGA